MGREIRRVPLDFTWELNKVWEGFLTPDRLDEDKCPDCKSGYSPHAQHLHDLWYGHVPFDPESTGSTPFPHTHPVIRERAQRNLTSAPEYYGTDHFALVREARRLADHFNRGWCHHLSQDDVDALLAADRLWEFTRKVVPGKGWQKLEPAPPKPTAEQVNEWSLSGFGHDGMNAGVVVRARCEREGFEVECSTCGGYGSVEAYPGQRAEAEAWEPTDPPTGEGWQLWETVSEGSPISPVFATPEELAEWMSSPAYTWGAVKEDSDRPTYETALRFVEAGWAPSFVSTPQTGLVSGVEHVGARDE